MKTNKNLFGHTILEIIIASTILLIIISLGYNSFLLFKKGFRKTEEQSSTINEVALFISKLRNDVINSVIPEKIDSNISISNSGLTSIKPFKIDNNKLEMYVFKDPYGKTEKISYIYTKDNLSNVFFVERVTPSSNKKFELTNISSFSWKVDEEKAIIKSQKEIRRMWLDIYISVISNTAGLVQQKPIEFKIKIFPIRLNKQLNN